MKKLILIATAMISTSILANPVELNKESIDYGALAQVDNGAANELIEVVRTPETPAKVTLKYKVNYVDEECTNYTILYTKVEPIVKTQCQPRLDGTYACEEVTHKGYGIPKRVCASEGMVLKSKNMEVVLNFRKAIELTEGSQETFQVSLKQKKMEDDSMKLGGKSVSSMAKYKVRTWGDSVIFKAK